MSILPNRFPIIPGPVVSAKNMGGVRVMSAPLPNVSRALMDWFRPMIITVTTTSISTDPASAGETVTQAREARTSGVILDMDGQKLEIGADGERSWDSATLFCLADFDVGTDAILKIDGVPYRVIGKKDRSESGYIRYEISQDYVSSPAT